MRLSNSCQTFWPLICSNHGASARSRRREWSKIMCAPVCFACAHAFLPTVSCLTACSNPDVVQDTKACPSVSSLKPSRRFAVPPALLPSSRGWPSLGHDHWLMKRSFEQFVRVSLRSCRGLSLPYFLGLDTDVINLLLEVIEIRIPSLERGIKDGKLTSVRHGPGVVIRNPSSPYVTISLPFFYRLFLPQL